MVWNCSNSSLQALVIFPRNDNFDGRDGKSPMISPRESPLLHRKGAAPTNVPPPVPVRRTSPILGCSTNITSSNGITITVEEAFPSPFTSADSSQKIDSDSFLSGAPDVAYDVLQTYGMNCLSSPSMISTGEPAPKVSSKNLVPSLNFPLKVPTSEDNLQYAELLHLSEGPRYENVLLPEKPPSQKKNLSTVDTKLDVKDAGHLSTSPLQSFSASISPSSPCFGLSTSSTSSSSPRLLGSSTSLPITGSSYFLSSNPHPHTHPLPSPSGLQGNDMNITFRKSSFDEQRFELDEKHQINLNNNENAVYENLNVDYIAQLTREGYTHDAVIRALGITKNDVKMACDILHEFATKQTTGTTTN